VTNDEFLVALKNLRNYETMGKYEEMRDTEKQILAAFAELRAERDAANKAADDAEINMVDMGNQLNVALERERVLRKAIRDALAELPGEYAIPTWGQVREAMNILKRALSI